MSAEVLSIIGRRRKGSRQDQTHWPRDRVTDEASLRRRIRSFPIAPKASSPTPDPRLAQLASALIGAHENRGRYFSPELFADPVWAMMLLIYVSEGRNADMPVNSLCESQAIGPATVTLRWIAMLLDNGILERTEDAARPGHAFVRLSPGAHENLEEWLRHFEARLPNRDLTDATRQFNH